MLDRGVKKYENDHRRKIRGGIMPGKQRSKEARRITGG